LPEQALSDFRLTPAWVLLGEPGAGKSEALNIEAHETGGHYLTARELITANPVPEQWRGKTLFIDALDESRAEGVDSLALRISNQLRILDYPPFRLACRAADWYGPSDRADLQQLSPNGKLVTLAAKEIDERVVNKQSIMPAGLDKQISRQELADLLAFLKATRWK
jgi:hypothetical protein